MDTVPIDALRATFAQSIIATMASQLSCYLRLVTHPDVQFADLLDALTRNAIIGDDAAMRLHRRLGIPGSESPPLVQRAYWEQVLRERGIDPASNFHTGTPPAAAPVAEPAPTT